MQIINFMRQRSFMTDEQITARIEQEFKEKTFGLQMELIQLAINEKGMATLYGHNHSI